MKHPIAQVINLALLLLFFSSCSDTGKDPSGQTSATVEFRSPNGDIVAIRNIKGPDTSWTFNNALGEPLLPYDSLWVGTDTTGQPRDVIFFIKGHQTLISFYPNMQKMAEGELKNQQREGSWTAYDMETGKKQSETDFVNGLEHGSYTVYNFNGTPRIIGQYNNGNPIGEWSFYDDQGNLAGTKKYGN